MPPSHGEISHVSDTALMVAACRALEFDAPDGFVRDPFEGPPPVTADDPTGIHRFTR